MTRTGRFDHHADGRDCLIRAKTAGYDPLVVCENLFQCKAPGGISSTQLADATVRGWLASDGHRRNLLSPRVRDIGVGVAGDPQTGTYYIVEVLGSPRMRRNAATSARR